MSTDNEQLTIFDFLIEEDEERESPPADDTSTATMYEPLPLTDYKEPLVPDDDMVNFFFLLGSTSISNSAYQNIFKLETVWDRPLYYTTNFYETTYDQMKNFIFTFNIFTGYEKDELKNRLELDKLVYEDLYVPIFQIDDVEHLPFITLNDEKKKREQFVSQALNITLPMMKKEKIGDDYQITLPEDIYANILPYLEPYPLYHKDRALIHPDYLEDYYFLTDYIMFFREFNKKHPKDTILSFKDVCSRWFGKDVVFNSETLTLTAKHLISPLSVEQDRAMPNWSYFENIEMLKRFIGFFQLLLFLSEATPLLLRYKKEKEQITYDVSDVAHAFIDQIKAERLFPLDEIDHKTGVKKAEKAELTHLFLPFSNKQPLFKTETPVLINTTKSTDTVDYLTSFQRTTIDANEYEVSIYKGFYDKYPGFSMRQNPHVTGEALRMGVIDEDEFNASVLALAEELDASLYHTIKESLSIIDQHRLIQNKMEQHYYTEEKTKTNFVSTYDSLYPVNFPESVLNQEDRKLYDSNDMLVETGRIYNVKTNNDDYLILLKDIDFPLFDCTENNIKLKGHDIDGRDLELLYASVSSIEEETEAYDLFKEVAFLQSVKELRKNEQPYTFALLAPDGQFYFYHKDDMVYKEMAVEQYFLSENERNDYFVQKIKGINREHSLFNEPFMLQFFTLEDSTRRLSFKTDFGIKDLKNFILNSNFLYIA